MILKYDFIVLLISYLDEQICWGRDGSYGGVHYVEQAIDGLVIGKGGTGIACYAIGEHVSQHTLGQHFGLNTLHFLFGKSDLADVQTDDADRDGHDDGHDHQDDHEDHAVFVVLEVF